ncbi:hypothetical protein D9757_011862 [Collybiopsis confluens]|uniref:Methyltransferase domain-containing protein n=1 Tax=Collybiopsis confluens TaxID=2823264 RepID=A0A8H5FY53_9AGAR|nr:hypothetical protein D9757_011862 [Collybiopsis confluens]
MEEDNQQRYYASKNYPLPADEAEIERLNVQHPVIVRSFENRLSLAPLDLKSGDRVLESIWALEFFEENKRTGINLDIECFDISNRVFPKKHPPNVHFSVHSVTDLPAEWNSTFSYIHQRLLIAVMTDDICRRTISELFRALAPGGWAELVEIEGKDVHFGIGPASNKVQSILLKMYAEKGMVGNLDKYLPPVLEEVGFVDVRCEVRHTLIGQPDEGGYSAEEWGKFWRGLRRDVLERGGYGLVQSGEEYEKLVDETVLEWETGSNKAYITYYTFLGRKP